MTSDDIIALAITGTVGLILTVMAILLLLGKGSFLIAGFNTMSKQEKETYDIEALCRFTGKILLPIGILMPFVVLDIPWLSGLYTAVVVSLSFFAAIYCNTGNRFKKR